MKWTESEINFLIENYPKNGPNFIANKLNRTKDSINIKLKSLGIRGKINKKYKKINLSLTKNQDLYIMGLLWADGYIHDTKHRLELSIVKDDFLEIKNLFNEENWNIKERIRPNRKTQITAGIYNKEICEIFRSKYNFLDKSLECPNFIDQIPKDKIFYFIRGFFDGDGCFYLSKDNKQKQCFFSGTYEQDWTWLEEVLGELGIEYKKKKKIQNEKSRCSILHIIKKDIEKFGNFIYKDYNLNKIGLNRKYEKFIKMFYAQ